MGSAIPTTSRRQLRRAAIGALLALAGGAGEAQEQRRPDFTSRVDLVTTDVVVRDNKGQFIADLKKGDFEVLEDGVPQTLVSFSLTHGGRTYNIDAPPRQAIEGLAVPPPRPARSESGRIFFILIDDLHLDFRDTARVRDLLKRISTELVHEGDMFGIVSTGPSAIEINLTYDRRRLDEAARKLSGSALSPGDIISTPQGAQGPPEVRHKAHVAFSTAADAMRQLAEIHDRRKAFI
jgi:VWFA-related protein